jgi:hemoglobin/transferrin/lactoferrin receptor protein
MTTRHKTTTAMALCLAASGLAALALPVAAQDAPADTLYLGRIIIGYSTDGTPIYAGESTTSLDEDDLRQTGGTSGLHDVLRRQTSVFTQMDIGNPGVAVNIRGFEGSGRVSATIDGVPQTYRITGHSAQSAVFVDPNLLAGIDITRGAVITAGGSGIAGSVNFRTISAEDLVRDGKTWGSVARLSYGSNGDKAAGMIGTAYRDDRFSALFAISRTTGENYEDGDDAIVTNTWEDTGSGLLKLGYAIDDRQSITFSAMRYEADFFATSYVQDLTNTVYSLGYALNAGDGLVDLNVNLYSGKNEVLWVSGGPSAGRLMSVTTTGFNATNISELAFGNWDLISINGIDYSRDEVETIRGGVNPSGNATRFSLFSENIFSSGNWEVTAGLRANTYNLEGTSTLGSLDNDFESIDPKLTVAYRLSDWLQPYVTVSKGTRMPTVQETLLGGTHPGGGVAGMIANPDLLPEEATGYEIGFNLARDGLFTATDSLTGRVNYYNMDVKNYITASYPGTITNIWGATGIAFINQPGTAKTSGLEVELNYSDRFYDFGIAYTKNDSDMPSQTPGLGAGQYLPDSTLSLSAAARFMGDKLTVGGMYNYTSGGLYNALYDPVAVQRDQSYETVDLYAVYEVSETFTINAKIENVFDKTYTPWLSLSENGPGRSASIGAEMRF